MVGGARLTGPVTFSRPFTHREHLVEDMEMTRLTTRAGVSALLAGLVLIGGCTQTRQASLLEAYAVIEGKKFVDLTHAFEPGIPRWPGFPDEQREKLYGYEPGTGFLGHGFWAERFSHVGQWGTHCDPPAHFVKGLRTIDQIPVKEMLLPLVIIDIHDEVAGTPDYCVTMEDVRDWEARHGTIPEGTFVALRTDWSQRWPDAVAMRNGDGDGVAH